MSNTSRKKLFNQKKQKVMARKQFAQEKLSVPEPDETVTVSEVTASEETVMTEEINADTESAKSDETVSVDETVTIDQIPASEEMPQHEETSTTEETATIEETPAITEETPATIEETPAITGTVESTEVPEIVKNEIPDDVERLLKKIKMEITLSDETTINKEIIFSGKEITETKVTQPPEDNKMPWVTVVILIFIVCASLMTGIYHWFNAYYKPADTVDPGHVIAGPETTPDAEHNDSELNNNEETGVTPQPNEPEPEEPESRHPIDPPEEFLLLWEEYNNEDIVAILTFGDTETLLVQGLDNAFYITHDIHRNLSLQGWLFLDYRVDLFMGMEHNMVIFDPVGEFLREVLQNYTEYDFFLRNPTITLSSIYGEFEWEIFSYYIAPADFPFATVNHPNDEIWGEVLEQFTLASLYNTRLDVNPDDQILTIAVPTTVNPELFYILQARMLRQITS